MSETIDSETEGKARTKRQKKNALPCGRAFAGSADEQGNQTDDPQVKRIEYVEKVLGECGFGAAGAVVHGQEGEMTSGNINSELMASMVRVSDRVG